MSDKYLKLPDGLKFKDWGSNLKDYFPYQMRMIDEGSPDRYELLLSKDETTIMLYVGVERMNHVYTHGTPVERGKPLHIFGEIREYSPKLIGRLWRMGYPFKIHDHIPEMDAREYFWDHQ